MLGMRLTVLGMRLTVLGMGLKGMGPLCNHSVVIVVCTVAVGVFGTPSGH